MDAIYAKIQMAEEHLRNLRVTLQYAEVEYNANGPSSITPVYLAKVTLPFVESACASAKAALVSTRTRQQ
jgi:hypothetical protein